MGRGRGWTLTASSSAILSSSLDLFLVSCLLCLIWILPFAFPTT